MSRAYCVLTMNKIDSLCPYGAYILAGDTNFTQQFSYSCEKAMAPHSSTLAWKIPRMEKPSGLQSMGLLRVGHDWATSLSFSLSCIGEGNGNPLQCSCLENPRDEGAWWAAIYGVAQSRTRQKRLSSSSRSMNHLAHPAQKMGSQGFPSSLE